MKLIVWMFVALLMPFGGMTAVFNVRDFGAVGDGVADDTDSIRKAAAKLAEAKGGELLFPLGDYRTAGRGAILTFKEVSNLTIRFENGARLLVDNLKSDGSGNGHGIHIAGPAHDIVLLNVTVEWMKRPRKRSFGDGIRFDGFPKDDRTIERIQMLSCRVVNAPQAGAIFHGCSNVVVRNFRPEKTLADGLHFNACRRVLADGVFGVENGDDTLAFVTYFSKGSIGAYGGTRPPYTQPGLYGWSNTDSFANNIVTNGGKACGVRVSGGKNITVSNVSVLQKWYGVQIDAARKTTADRAVGWSYLASQNITFRNVSVRNCATGVTVRTLNLEMDDPVEEWRPESLVFDNLNISNCKKGLMLRDTTGILVSRLWSDSPVRVINNRGRIALREVVLKNSNLEILGTQNGKVQAFNRSREGEPFVAADDLSDLVPRELTLSGVEVENGRILLKNCAGVRMKQVAFRGSGEGALQLEKVRDSLVDTVSFTEIPAGCASVIDAVNCRDVELRNFGKAPIAPALLQSYPVLQKH